MVAAHTRRGAVTRPVQAPRCPGCDAFPIMLIDAQAFCGNDECRALLWNIYSDPAKFKATARVIDLDVHEERKQ